MVIWAESKCSLLIFQPSLKEQSQGKMQILRAIFTTVSNTVLRAVSNHRSPCFGADKENFATIKSSSSCRSLRLFSWLNVKFRVVP